MIVYFDRELYNRVVVPLIFGALKTASLFDHKIRRGFRERRDVWEKLNQSTLELTDDQTPRFWIHTSSAGEFLQSIPVLEEIKVLWPSSVILFTYFSPSAHTLVSSSDLVDIPSFLPLDRPRNAGRIFSLFRPDILLFCRYDVWPNLVWEAARRRCPAILINATLNRLSSRMRPLVRGFFGRVCREMELICAASPDDRENFLSIGVPAWKIEVTGDTKYDETYRRVMEVTREKVPLQTTLEGRRVILGGSSWPPEEKILLSAFAGIRDEYEDAYLVLVPHEPTRNRIRELMDKVKDMGFRPETFTVLRDSGWKVEGDVLIVDQVGFLAHLYTLADIALVGGGFLRGVHNVLEPATLGIPVLMGPNYQKSPEAVSLVREGGAMIIEDELALKHVVADLFQNPAKRKSMGELAIQNINKNREATGRLLAVLQSTFPILFPSGNKPSANKQKNRGKAQF